MKFSNSELILKELPARSGEAGYRLCAQLLAGGRDSIVSLIVSLIARVGDEFGVKEGVQSKYAIRRRRSVALRFASRVSAALRPL